MKGPTVLPSGDVISAALMASPGSQLQSELGRLFRLDVGQIVAIYDAESPNTTRPGVKPPSAITYDVEIISTNGATEVIPRCRMLQPSTGGSITNYHEVLPPDPGVKGKDINTARSLRRGTNVLVGYINGEKANGIILGAIPHENPVATKARPKKAKGTHLEGEFQGLTYSIDNDGALKLVFNGPRKDDGSLSTENGPTAIEITKDGNINITNNKEQKVSISRTEGKIRVEAGTTYIDMDQNADKIDVVAKNVNVGTGSLQPQVVGDDWKKIMEELITEISQIYVPTGVGPSGTPVNASKFMAIKGKLEDALSKKHKVEK